MNCCEEHAFDLKPFGILMFRVRADHGLGTEKIINGFKEEHQSVIKKIEERGIEVMVVTKATGNTDIVFTRFDY